MALSSFNAPYQALVGIIARQLQEGGKFAPRLLLSLSPNYMWDLFDRRFPLATTA